MTELYAGLTVLEVIGIAVKKEIDAARFYQDLAEHIPNPIVKARFLDLAKEERTHRALLQAEYKRLTGQAQPPVPNANLPRTEDFDFATFDIERALAFAIAAERDAQQLYAQAAQASGDPRGKRMLEYLVAFERGHEEQLKAELDFYRKAPLWFEETEDLLHVGP